MRQNFLLEALDNKYYYEGIDKLKSSEEFYNIASSILPKEWELKKSSIYLTCMNKAHKIPLTGWKIHISATLTNCKEILEFVSKAAVENNFSFKFMRDTRILQITSQKAYSRGGSGKFITIYPENEDAFLKLLEIFYAKLKDFKGPYILSDRRYKNCKVLYYRYGGMIGQYRMEKDGDLVPIIKDGNGKWIDDIRNPYFSVPANIKNPIPEPLVKPVESHLDTNYRIDKPLVFSNSGGVYEGVKLEDGRRVIIKEARPYTCFVDDEKDSIYLREKEYFFLKKLEKSNMVPTPIELFKEWEHIFLVEEFLEGKTLKSFCAQHNPFYKTFKNSENIDTYIKNLTKVFLKIVDFIKMVHESDLILADLSPNNIMITEDLQVKFIDLEACIEKGDESFAQMSTSGYSEKITKDNFIESDLYALGCVFFSCLAQRNEMIRFDHEIIKRFLDSLSKDYSLPQDLVNLILDLTQKDFKKRPSLDQVKERLEAIEGRSEVCIKRDNKLDYEALDLKYSNLTKECIKAIDNTANLEEKERLFPNTPCIDNSLNITCGALGNIYMMNCMQAEEKINRYMPWVMDKLEKIDSYAPGLYVGVSGVAWVLLELGYREKAMEVLKKIDKNPLFDNNFGIRCGLAGYGLTLLKFFLETKEEEFLEKAVYIGDTLITCAKIDELNKTACWPEGKKEISIGYGDGATGIALFLLYLSSVSKEERFLETGKLALRYDLKEKILVEGTEFYSFPRDNSLAKPLYPYFTEGNSGVISVLLRYYKVTKDSFFMEEINSLLPGIYVKYAINPGLFFGLTSLGNTLLDCYEFLGDRAYKEMAYDVAEGIYLYKIDSPDGVLFPGNLINKLSTDLGSGTSGIVLFFNRLVNNSGNFCFFLDELLR